MTLSARNLCVDLQGRRIVAGVDLDVAPGELVVLAGGNGAGKSTLLRALSGELEPSGGSVTLDGRDLASWPAPSLARLRAVLRQRTDVAFPMSVFEVALLGRLPHNGGVESGRDRSIVRTCLRRTGTLDLARRSYTTLSGGEKQRVQVARVLAQIHAATTAQARYLLLDEPTTGLDLVHQHLCLRLARRTAAGGAGVLAVLHDLELAARYADRVVLLRDGRVEASGSTREVLTQAAIASVFGVRSRARVDARSGRLMLRLGPPCRADESGSTHA